MAGEMMRLGFSEAIVLAPRDILRAHAKDLDGNDVTIEFYIQAITRGSEFCSMVEVPGAKELASDEK